MPNASQHVDLQAAAADSMRAHGFEPEFSPQVLSEVAALEAHPPPVAPGEDIRDLRELPWSSIDNDTSRDLDQLEVAERTAGRRDEGDGGDRRRRRVRRRRTRRSTSTPPRRRRRSTRASGTFRCCPRRSRPRATSLLEGQDKLARRDRVRGRRPTARVQSSDVYRAVVRNTAQLTYDDVGAWLDGGPAPTKVAASPALQSQLRLQDARGAGAQAAPAIVTARSTSRRSKRAGGPARSGRQTSMRRTRTGRPS